MGFLLDSDVGFEDDSSGIFVVSTNSNFDFKIDGNSVGVEIGLSFSVVDDKFTISPFGDSLDFNQKFSMEEFIMVLNIKIESFIQVCNGDLQSGTD